MSVLDVGCGTGSITSGIAKTVGADGRVVGLDRDVALLELARAEHRTIPNLRFEAGDAKDLAFRAEFDIVSAARALQWMADPGAVVRRMTAAVKPSGRVVVLDYNHAHNSWEPEPPDAFRRFYQAFLTWRQENDWDNEMASHLPEHFRSAGLVEIESGVQDEIVARPDPDFAERSALWLEVIESLGNRLAESGFCTESELHRARDSYRSWVKTELIRQILQMRTVIGKVCHGREYSPGPAAV
jgi:SAM-dependent methyltransferase